jgi:putative SOS response-associated peptidase YedK
VTDGLSIPSAPLRQLSSIGIHRPVFRDREPASEPRADLEYGAHDGRAFVRLNSNGERHLGLLKWGLVPYFTRPEESTQADQRQVRDDRKIEDVFRAAFAQRRCLVPAPAYYEWRDDPNGKTPFAVARIDGDPVAFGGIWEVWKKNSRTVRS